MPGRRRGVLARAPAHGRPARRPRVAGDGYSGQPWVGAQLPRVGFPGIAFSDGPRGVVIGANTCFPVSMARGATWDPDLEERIGEAIGLELRASGANLFGGVNVNLLRHPAWGRAQETYGEDPHHVGEMGAALARGVQRHAMACVKHFALNSIDNARFKVDVQADERTLHEVYLPALQARRRRGRRLRDVGVQLGQRRVVRREPRAAHRDPARRVGLRGFRHLRLDLRAARPGEVRARRASTSRCRSASSGCSTCRGRSPRAHCPKKTSIAPVARIVETLLRFDAVLSQPAPDASVAASRRASRRSRTRPRRSRSCC